jgi:hypothetical protein
VHADQKSLLVRADFMIGISQNVDRIIYHRWRRIMIDALPRLLGCSRICPKAERVCLHKGQTVGRYSAWLRIPVQRQRQRSFVQRLETRLTERLESGLKPVQGEVISVRARRCMLPEALPLFKDVADEASVGSNRKTNLNEI